MKILIFGGSGQLGRCLQRELSSRGIQYLAPDRMGLDLALTEDFTTVLEKFTPDAVINAAAYTAVDKAEQDENSAYVLNAKFPERLAKVCGALSIPLYHISTDYVFDGTGCKPYTEQDLVAPVSIYGKSKLLGEQMVLKHSQYGAIIRTSWLYSEFGHNFMKTILRLSETNSKLAVVADQVGSPTYAGDLANAIIQIIQKTTENPPATEIYHYANYGVASWYDFAWHILHTTNSGTLLKPIKTEEYPTPAKRPPFSVLNSKKISEQFAVTNRHWLEAFTSAIQRIN